MTAEQLSQYDVVWTTPSQDATGSMPIGNGDLAANVWVEPNGDVLILVAKNDAWDENSTLCKLGRLRLTCNPPLDVSQSFSQRLSLGNASITVKAAGVSIWLCVDASTNQIEVRVDTDSPRHVAITLETWRNYPYVITTQTGDMFKNLTGKDLFTTLVTPDQMIDGNDGELIVFHENLSRENDPHDINLKLQGLSDADGAFPSPLTGRKFGMLVSPRGMRSNNTFRKLDSKNLVSKNAQTFHHIRIFAETIPPGQELPWGTHWWQTLYKYRTEHEGVSSQHIEWWTSFWRRTHILISSETEADNAFNVTRAYVLQRYLNACQGRGEFPIKHNGGLFTVGRPWDPDFRRWGGPGFWFMNQRLIYWPMLADGDFDLMKPWLAMYRRTLPLQMHRTKKYFGHAGAHYPETMTFWGAEVSGHYGWTPFEERERPEAECAYLTYYWSGAIELILILCEYLNYAGQDEFVAESLDAIGTQILTFYEQHYPREADGTLRFEPAQALETWHKAINPMPEIAGLRYTLDKLLALPTTFAAASLREQAERLKAVVPPIPVGEKDGQQVLLPAAHFDIKKNTENPELYCIFPYRLFGVGKPDLALARRTFEKRLHVEHTCWHQDVIQMALLGLTDQAKDFVSRRASDECHKESRFPAFWDAFHDWIPDLDHGGVLQLAVQNMLIQCEGRQVRLLPAWPREWDVDFKLHIPGPAVIQGQVKNGGLVNWSIDPPERAKDVLISDRTS